MSLYLIVRHNHDEAARKTSHWINVWDPKSGCLKSITTDAEVATRCEEAKAAKERIYVYRCAYGGQPAVVACSVAVDRIQHVDGDLYLVEFVEAKRMSAPPPFVARRGWNMEEAAPPLEKG